MSIAVLLRADAHGAAILSSWGTVFTALINFTFPGLRNNRISNSPDFCEQADLKSNFGSNFGDRV
jgi:hypothetical protein